MPNMPKVVDRDRVHPKNHCAGNGMRAWKDGREMQMAMSTTMSPWTPRCVSRALPPLTYHRTRAQPHGSRLQAFRDLAAAARGNKAPLRARRLADTV